MTILAIMRHAKSDWGESGLADFDRPLNRRGRKAAAQVGRELKRRGVRFDRVLASPALRVRETLERLDEGYGGLPEPQFERRIYDAGLDALFELVRTIPDTAHAPLLVGHNPGLHQLLLHLTSEADGLRSRVSDNLPTAAFALIELPATRWEEVESGAGRLAELILPREIDD